MQKKQATLPRAEFERLVRDHHAAVYASAMRILRDGGAALDVTQDVYVALLEGRIALSGTDDERVLRWFAIRGSLQVLRERANRRLREEHFAMHQPEAQLDTSVQDVDAASAVERFVARLPEELRAAVHLRFHEGLTFARIGEALEISEPAAHERVKRALERLKDGLSRAGLAAAAIDLERALEMAPTTPPAPLFVAKQLVALHSGAGTASIATALIGSVLLVAAVVFVVPKVFDERTEETRVALAPIDTGPATQVKVQQTITESQPAPARTAVAPSLVQSGFSNAFVPAAAETQGTIVGRLVDAEHLPVADVIVNADSLERQGKFARWGARAKTGKDGRFEISVVVGTEGATNYSVSLEKRITIADRSALDLVRVQSEATVDVGVLRLAPRTVDREGDFELALQVVGPNGPLEDLNVMLFRAVRAENGWSDRTFEAHDKTDDSGRVRLEGKHVGKKVLLIDARPLGLRRVERELELAEGKHALTITLEPGLEIQGRLVDVQGQPIARPPGESRFGDVMQLYATSSSARDEWIFSAIEDDGRFTFIGLDPIEYDLEISHGPWSSICVDGVRAGAKDVLIALKRRDDPLDRGNHCAELHARVVDEVTKEPVAVDSIECVEVERLDDGTSLERFDRDLPAALRLSAPVQREMSGSYPAASDRVRTTSLEPGTYALIVRAPGYAAEFAAPIALAPHQIRNDLVVQLVRPTRLSGRVLDDSGRPCAGAFVFVNGIGPKSTERTSEYDRDVAETDGHPSAARWELVRTDAQGTFVINGLSPRYDYVCEALHARYAPVASARFMGRDPGVVELRFTKKR